MKRIIVTVLVMAMLIALISACNASTPQSESSSSPTDSPSSTVTNPMSPGLDVQPKYGGILKLGGGNTDSFNPCRAGGRMATFKKLLLVYDRLIDKDMDTDTWIPMLAKSWNISTDGLVYTFELRDDVTFHDGEKFNAAAAKYCLEFFRDHELNAGGMPADELIGIRAINTLGEYTLELNLTETSGIMIACLADLAGCMISQKAINACIANNGDQIALVSGGSGPFILDADNTILDQTYVYKRNPNYWQKDDEGNQLPYVDGIVQTVSADETVNVQNLISGEFHHITTLNELVNINRIETTPGVWVVPTTGVNNLRTYFNTSQPPFDDIRVREALVYAMDGETISDILAGEYGFQLPWIVLPTQSYFFPADDYLGMYDPNRARMLLAEAGYPNGFDTEIWVGNQFQAHVKLTELVVEQLAEVGVNARIEVAETSAIRQVWNASNPDTPSGMLTINTSFPRIDPWHQYNNDLGTAGGNFAKAFDPDFQDLLLRIKSESNWDKRLALLEEIQKLGLSRFYLALHYNKSVLHAARDELHGVYYDFRGAENFTRCWLDD